MNKVPYEIPAEMRDFAEKSVDQARKAFDGFVGAAHKAAGSAEGQAASVQTNAKDLGEKAIGYAQSNINAAFDLAQKLVKAKDFTEVLAIQTEFAKAQVAAIQAQVKDLGTIVQQAVTAKK